jgi:hypothetical protein
MNIFRFRCELCNSFRLESQFVCVETCECDESYLCLVCLPQVKCKVHNMIQHVACKRHIAKVRTFQEGAQRLARAADRAVLDGALGVVVVPPVNPPVRVDEAEVAELERVEERAEQAVEAVVEIARVVPERASAEGNRLLRLELDREKIEFEREEMLFRREQLAFDKAQFANRRLLQAGEGSCVKRERVEIVISDDDDEPARAIKVAKTLDKPSSPASDEEPPLVIVNPQP